jgi:diguanylate cyclase (GGDEF)-like protein/PAS domain S-box-containing protein
MHTSTAYAPNEFSSRPTLLWLCLLVALVGVTSFAGLILAADTGGVAPIWYTNGILAGLLLRSPTPHWPYILSAGFVGNVVADLVVGDSIVLGTNLTLCNILEVMVAAWGIRRQVGDDLEPERLLGSARVGVLWSILAPIPSGILAALLLWQSRSVPGWQTFSIWYPADVLGMIIMPPLVLVARRKVFVDMLSVGRARHTVLALGLLVVASAAVFAQDAAPLLFAIFPPLLYVVFQLGFAGASIGVVLVTIAGVVGTVLGHGPLVLMHEMSMQGRILMLQFFVATALLMVFPVGIALSERRRLQRTLQESERRYRTLADNSSDIIVRAAQDGTRLYISPSVSEILGWTPEELLGPARIDLIHPQDRTVFDEELDAMRHGATSSVIVYRYQHKLGHYVWVESTARKVADETPGIPQEIVRVIRDISKRKQAEEALLRSERTLRSVSDSLPALIARIDGEERYTFTNEYYRTVFGVDPASFIGKAMRETLGDELYENLKPSITAVKGGDATHFETEQHEHGVPQYFHGDYIPDRDAEGRVIGFYIMVMDITARKVAEMQQAESEQRLWTIADNLPVLISFVDKNGIVRFCNATYETWLGKTRGDLIGRPLREALGEENYDAQAAQFRQALAGKRVEFELDVVGPDGIRNAQAVYVPERQPDGRVAGVYTLTMDMTTIRRVEQELQRLARFDSLTALANRRQFDERLQQVITRVRRSGRPLVLMFLDIDHFKAINDAHGHAGGDEVLQEFAWRLRTNVRDNDFVARLAGDEFVILLEDVETVEEAHGVAGKIIAAIEKPFELMTGDLPVTASIGVAFVPDGKYASVDIVQAADQVLYEAKAAGRNGFRVAVCPSQ